jgi:gamma-glutamyltranspeptidase/glutathione hydrolase
MQAAGDMARFSHNQVRNELQLESQLFRLVGARLQNMGHTVIESDGDPVGGYEGIMFTPDASAGSGCAPADATCTAAIAGYYRAGSNFREDGQAAGY